MKSFFSNDNKDDYIVKMFDVKDNRGSLDSICTYTMLIRHPNNVKLKTKKIYENLEEVKKDLSREVKMERKSIILGSIEIIGQDITYPLYGNKHSRPYGKLVVNGEIGKKICVIKEDSYLDYITYNRKRYYVKNNGRYMSANYVVDIGKTKEYYNSKGYNEVIV